MPNTVNKRGVERLAMIAASWCLNSQKRALTGGPFGIRKHSAVYAPPQPCDADQHTGTGNTYDDPKNDIHDQSHVGLHDLFSNLSCDPANDNRSEPPQTCHTNYPNKFLDKTTKRPVKSSLSRAKVR
jgi:hypothetical protein